MPNVRVRVVAAWALSLMLSLLFLNQAIPKLIGQPGLLQRFEEWGYSARFASGIGMLEITGAALLLFPSMATYGALLLSAIMVGAIYTHLSTGILSPAFAVQMLFMCAALAALRYPEMRRQSGGGTPPASAPEAGDLEQ